MILLFNIREGHGIPFSILSLALVDQAGHGHNQPKKPSVKNYKMEVLSMN